MVRNGRKPPHQDIIIRLPGMALAMVVQRLVGVAEGKAAQAEERAAAAEARVAELEAQLEV